MEQDLGFELGHVGINCADEKAAESVAELFSAAFGFTNKSGKSSIFSSSGIEVMKSPYLGALGHIAIRTNDLSAAIEHLAARGFAVDPKTEKFDENGNKIAVYLTREFGGFAVHLVQKR